MPAPINPKAIEVHATGAFHKKMLRKSFAIALGIGFSAAMSSCTFAQYNEGDIPASPWSRRNASNSNGDSNEASKSSNRRLRQPTVSAPASNSSGINLQLESNPSRRPAPVTLQGPATSEAGPHENRTGENVFSNKQTSSASFGRVREFLTESEYPADRNERMTPLVGSTAAPSQALTQKTPIAAQSDWQRLPAGGPPMDGPEVTHQTFRPAEESTRSNTTPQRAVGIALGLPDRLEDQSNSIPASQVASSRTKIEQREPIRLHSSTPTNELPEQAQNPNGLSNSSRSTSITATEPINLTQPLHSSQHAVNHRDTVRDNGQLQAVETSEKNPIVFPNTNTVVSRLEKSDIATSTEPEIPQKVEPRTDETQMRRIALAERVSHELLSSPPADFASAPQALESLPGWQSIERELRERLDRCDKLLKRGAVLSAREEASEGLLRLFRTMDLHRGKMFSESAFEKAIIALREEADFQKSFGGRQGSVVQSIVNTHSTEALKNRPLDSTSPDMAAMHYRWYARFQLVAASDKHPWAADLLYAFGKTIEKEADLNPSKANQFRSQAVVFYQAATQVKPTHSEASSQLGFALIHLDRIEDAYAALSESIKANPSPNAWNNLAELFRRRGANSEAEYAVQQASALSRSTNPFSPENPEIVAVDPATFARYSPMPTMATAGQNAAGLSNGAQNTRGQNDRVTTASAIGPEAKSGNRFLSKIFR